MDPTSHFVSAWKTSAINIGSDIILKRFEMVCLFAHGPVCDPPL